MVIIIDSYIGFSRPITLTTFLKEELKISLKEAFKIRHNIVDIVNYEMDIKNDDIALRVFHKLMEVGITCHIR